MDTFIQDSEEFISDVVKIDEDVADIVRQRKDNWKSMGKMLAAVVIVVALGVATVLTGGTLGIIFAGAAFSGIGVVGSALGNYLGGSCKFANCASKILNILKCTSKVTGVLSLGMEAFDSLSMIVGIFDPDNPSVVFNHKLHSSSLYNTFQIGDILVNSDREIYPVENIFFEVVEKPETVYNFQVEDFHTYHVSESSVLVYNAKNYKNYDPYDDISQKKNGKTTWRHTTK